MGYIADYSRSPGANSVFRRFMIVCWVLFSMAAVTSLVGYAGYRVNEEPALIIEPLSPGDEFTPLQEMTPVVPILKDV